MSDGILISVLIARLELLKKEHGDLVVCLNDENVGYIPIIEAGFESGVHVVDVRPEVDGIHPHSQTFQLPDPHASVKVLAIEWSC